jgi:uncharacterized surface protein with fasciclin (FAS1) repeats
MNKKILAGGAAVAMTLAMGAAVPASAAGDKPLSEVLTSDGNKFDRNGADFDIVTEAVLAVLADNPDSDVKVLTDGSVRLTAFAPTDKAFKNLATALTGKKVTSEAAAFGAVAGLGLDTVETVLLYHVVPGKTITAKQARKADGAALKTAQGGTIKVKVMGHGKSVQIALKDKDPDFADPRVILKATDINKGNKQIAHGINGVLLPVDL